MCGIDDQFLPTLYCAFGYLPMLGLKPFHVSKCVPRHRYAQWWIHRYLIAVNMVVITNAFENICAYLTILFGIAWNLRNPYNHMKTSAICNDVPFCTMLICIECPINTSYELMHNQKQYSMNLLTTSSGCAKWCYWIFNTTLSMICVLLWSNNFPPCSGADVVLRSHQTQWNNWFERNMILATHINKLTLPWDNFDVPLNLSFNKQNSPFISNASINSN